MRAVPAVGSGPMTLPMFVQPPDGTMAQRRIAYEAVVRARVALEEAWDNIVELDRRMEREIMVLTCQVAGVADAIRRGGGF